MKEQRTFDQVMLRDAAARGDLGMQQAADHADRVEARWTDQAFDAVRLIAPAMRSEFTFEQLRRDAEPLLSPPPDKRAWGQVARRAIRDGVIIATGRYSPRASGNCAPTMLYVCGNPRTMQ